MAAAAAAEARRRQKKNEARRRKKREEERRKKKTEQRRVRARGRTNGLPTVCSVSCTKVPSAGRGDACHYG